jgi:hypothetical protein
MDLFIIYIVKMKNSYCGETVKQFSLVNSVEFSISADAQSKMASKTVKFQNVESKWQIYANKFEML